MTAPLRLDRIRASQTRREVRRLLDASSLGVDDFAPYHCTGPLHRHDVTHDNPMRTGRCLSCRCFIGKTSRGWRTMTPALATHLNLYGARQ